MAASDFLFSRVTFCCTSGRWCQYLCTSNTHTHINLVSTLHGQDILLAGSRWCMFGGSPFGLLVHLSPRHPGTTVASICRRGREGVCKVGSTNMLRVQEASVEEEEGGGSLSLTVASQYRNLGDDSPTKKNFGVLLDWGTSSLHPTGGGLCPLSLLLLLHCPSRRALCRSQLR